MKNFFRLLLVVALCFIGLRSDGLTMVELKNGERISGKFSFQDGKLYVGDKGIVQTSDIRQVIFGSGASGSGTTSLSGADISRPARIASEAGAFIGKYPDAGGVVLADEIRHVFHDDGTHSMHVYFLGLVKKEDHKGWADQGFAFTEGRDRIHIRTARCIKSDGTVFNADPEKFKTSKPQVSPGVFIKYMQTSFRIPAVEVGCLVEVEWEQETYNPFRSDFFFPVNYFQGHDPVFYSRMTVEIPSDKNLFWEARNLPDKKSEPVQTTEGRVKRFVWETNLMPPVVPEPEMPKGGDALPYVQASLFEGWDKVFDWINTYWNANTKPTPELSSQTLEIIKGAVTEDEKVAKIFHWIQKNIRYIIIKGDAATVYGSYPAMETIQKQFGCCVDKALVLSAMLNAAGIKNGPLLINAGGQEMSKRIPNLSISHSISRVTRQDGKKYYLDSTGYDFRYPAFPTGNQGRLCIDPSDRTVDYIPMQEPEENMVRNIATMTLKVDGTIEVKLRKELTGEKEVIYRSTFKSLKPTEREEYLSSQLNSFGQGVKLIRMNIENLDSVEKPLLYDYEYTLASYPREIADLSVFKIPGFLENLRFNEASLASRTYPIEYDSTSSTVYQGVLNLPAGFTIRSVLEPLKIENPYFQFTGSYEKVDDRTLKYNGAIRFIAKKVPVDAYPAFKEDLNRIERFGRERIFLTRALKGE